jgi:HD superfamily phosphohydrolase
MPDRDRLVANLTVNAAGDRVALTEKGRVGGEIFLFCRYLMFSEVYWHHTARAASAMIEAALADLVAHDRPSPEGLVALLLGQSDDELLATLARSGGAGRLSTRLLAGLSPNARGLYKRVITLNRQREGTERVRAYDALYRLERAELEGLQERLGRLLSGLAAMPVAAGDVLVDTPPRDKDRFDSVLVIGHEGAGTEEAPLEDLSTVVRGIARDFVTVVKRIRVFVRPELRARLSDRRAAVEAALMEEILGGGAG